MDLSGWCCRTRRDSGGRRKAGEQARVLEAHPRYLLYTEVEAQRALTMLQPIGYQRWWKLRRRCPWSSCRPATARLGVLSSCGCRVVPLSLWRRPWSLQPSRAPRSGLRVGADVVSVESTYGDRDHQEDDKASQLAAVIHDTAARGGKLNRSRLRDRTRGGAAVLGSGAWNTNAGSR
jgi:hypothetical protein